MEIRKKSLTAVLSIALTGLVFQWTLSTPIKANEEAVKTEISSSGTDLLQQDMLPTVDSSMLRNEVEKERTETSEAQEEAEKETEESAVFPVEKRAVNLFAADTAEVTDWQTFVEALADSSITTILLANDIQLTGTLNNYEGLFDKDSVNLDTGYQYLFVSKPAISRSLVIDGNGHTFDFGNLAIGFMNAATNTSSYWDITLQNINVKSNNYYAPFFYPVLAESKGMTSYLSNSKLTYGEKYKHTRFVDTYEKLNVALATISVTNIQFVDDIVVPLGRNDTSRQVANINNAAERFAYRNSSSNTNGGTTFIYFNALGIARDVVIEGDGYTWDQGSITWCFTNRTMTTTSKAWGITLQNMNTFHGNYWGIMEFWDLSNAYQSRTTVNYIDFTNFGSQLIESQRSKVSFGGDVHVQQVATYTSVRKDGSVIRDFDVNYTHNQTISVAAATIAPNSNAYFSALSGVPIHLRESGNLEIGENAVVTAVRESETGNPENFTQGYASVIDISSGNFIIRSGAKVTAVSHHTVQPTVVYMENSNSNLLVEEGAVLSVITDRYSDSTNGARYNPFYMAGGKVSISGTLNITGENMVRSGTHLFYANAAVDFEIASKGILNIISDSTSTSQNLMYLGNTSSSFKFSDAERVNLQKTKSISGSNGLIYMRNGGVLNVSVQNVYQWADGNMATGVDGDEGYTYSYIPMSSMLLTYNGYTPTITSANSMTNATLNSFRANFTTRGQQRVLFTRIPDPSVSIHSISNDNPDDPGSYTVYGYAVPGTYIRLWEEALNGTTSAKEKGVNDTIESPVEDTGMAQETRDNFTVQADSDGNWSYTISSGNYFTAGNVIHAYGFANLKSEEPTQVVLDKTPPTATPVTFYISQGDDLPDPSAFVKDAADTSPINTGFDYAYTDEAEAEIQRNTVGTHTIKINVSDRATDADGNAAPNTAVIEATLIVYEKASGITADDLEVAYVDIRDLTDAELAAYILANSQPEAFNIANGTFTDLTEYVQVSDFGGLNEYGNLQPDTPYVVTLTVPANAATGLSTPLTTTIQVVVINMDAVLTVQFEDESGTVLSGYTLTIGEGQTIDTALNVGDVIDLTGSEFQAVQDQLTALETAGYEISVRPENETNFSITETAQTVTYKVTGQLFLKSAPSTVDFGSITYNAKVQRVDNPSTDGDLVVTDTRANQADGWTLYAALTTNMKNDETGSVMNEALWYVDSAGEEISLTLDSGGQPIYTNASGGTFDVTGTWGDTSAEPGLKLVADPTKTTVSSIGTYSGVVTWTIMAGQP
ncbi:hypothetical protein IW492_03260 [Enterococcus sp. BWB1-3]|uniref:pectate lyase-like adhesive domain-containing protein n=1 Tax=Enterococcus sp. BWB1-3 TaxID=2787713 RepID=UPI0019235B0F|nr:pectate lyase-like adhesive domain-containing protein [Enterococcus sp. BWB1-3]MBL1228252.1 hypothetical protein [Enterococcus sp. BWB1-3]